MPEVAGSELAAQAVRRHAPALAAAMETDAFVAAASIRQALGYRPGAVSTDALAALERELADLG